MNAPNARDLLRAAGGFVFGLAASGLVWRTERTTSGDLDDAPQPPPTIRSLDPPRHGHA